LEKAMAVKDGKACKIHQSGDLTIRQKKFEAQPKLQPKHTCRMGNHHGSEGRTGVQDPPNRRLNVPSRSDRQALPDAKTPWQ